MRKILLAGSAIFALPVAAQAALVDDIVMDNTEVLALIGALAAGLFAIKFASAGVKWTIRMIGGSTT